MPLYLESDGNLAVFTFKAKKNGQADLLYPQGASNYIGAKPFKTVLHEKIFPATGWEKKY